MKDRLDELETLARELNPRQGKRGRPKGDKPPLTVKERGKLFRERKKAKRE